MKIIPNVKKCGLYKKLFFALLTKICQNLQKQNLPNLANLQNRVVGLKLSTNVSLQTWGV